MMLSSPLPGAARSLRRRLFAALAPALALGACAPALGPLPRTAAPQSYATTRSFEAPEAAWPQQDWWRELGDPQLDALMDEALKDAPDLKAAEARVQAAEASVETSRAAERPQVDVKAQADEARISQSIGLPPQVSGFLPGGFSILTQTSASLSYALDFFGRNRALLAQATSLEAASEADRAEARLQLTSALASTYADFVRLSAQRAAAVESVRVRRDTLALVAQRRRNGLETRGEESQQAATVSQAQALVDSLDLQILQARHALAALAGAGPDRGLALVAPAPEALALRSFGLPPRLSADLLGRRPDLAAARLRAEAARHRIKAARADFYPNVDLAASNLLISLNNQNPLTHNIDLAEFGPALSLPIFTGGRLEGQLRGAAADYRLAVAEYDQAFTRALSEVADALAREREVAQQLRDARAALAADEDAYRIARLRYEGGLAPYLSVLTVETALLQQRQETAALSAESVSADIALVRALGGGYAGPDVRSPAAAHAAAETPSKANDHG